MKWLNVSTLKKAFMLILVVLCVGLLTPYAYASTSDAEVENYASFSTDVIYQIVTDRFYNGDPYNDPTGSIFNPSSNRFYHGGDWAGIIEKIEDGYLTDLGITAIWISAPVENIDVTDPADFSETWTSAAYHGYWAKDFFRTNPYFGTFSDFEDLIDVAHANDIKVVIDFAPNHTSTTSDYSDTWNSTRYPMDGALYQDGTLLGTVHGDATNNYFNHEGWISDWDSLESVTYETMLGLADLNQMNNTIDTYLKEAIELWLDLGVDGIRVDAVKHMPLGWQKNWVSSIYDHKPVFVFGEWFSGTTSPDSEMTLFANESGMSLLDFNLANSIRGAVGDLSLNMHDIHNTVLSTGAAFNQVNNQVTFIDNHDMSRFMTLSSNTAHSVDTAFVIQLTQRGVPAIYYGTEQYSMGAGDPDNRADMPSFNKTTTAYKVISALSPLRKTNPALAYGTYQERWINNDVYVYERKFGNSVVLTAVNRNTSTGYNIYDLLTDLPSGTYSDVLNGELGGSSLTVNSAGEVPHYYLDAGVSAVWEYTDDTYTSPIIGNVDPLMSKPGNTISISGRGFGNVAGTVSFGAHSATVLSWSDSLIKVTVPSVSAGTYSVTVTTASSITSSAFPNFKILSGEQTAVRFMVNDAYTSFGSNVYLVGNIPELGSWDPNKAIGPMFNNTPSIAMYPTWFFDVSVPKQTYIEYKFIKIDQFGNVTWESGGNHTYTTPSTTGQVSVNWQ